MAVAVAGMSFLVRRVLHIHPVARTLRKTSSASQTSKIRTDGLVALSIAFGCTAVLVEAYYRTDIADAEFPIECAYPPAVAVFTEANVRHLEEYGMVVIPNALSDQDLATARTEMLHALKTSDFNEHGNDNDVRQDRVIWMRLPSSGGLSHCIKLVRGIAQILESNNYTGSQNHLVPQQCQLACYTGDNHSGYQRHLDRCDASLFSLGLLEWLRNSDYRSRYVTVILYLNDADRTIKDGGALKCWLRLKEKSDKEFGTPVLVQPIGGTILIFDSDRIEHQVLPSSKDRYALTSWISGEQGRKESSDAM